MKYAPMAVAFLVGGAATFLTRDFVVDVRAQAVDGPVHACIAADGAMRAIPYEAACPQGQRSVLLKRAGPTGGIQSPPNNQKPADDSSKLDATILEDLNRRVIKLEGLQCAALGKSKVTAPFEVVDRSGNRIFIVDANGAGVYNGKRNLVAKIGMDAAGGFFGAQSAGGGTSATLGFTDEINGFGLREGDQLRVDLGKDAKLGSFRMRFNSSGGKRIAVIGQSAEGHGGVFVGDEQGKGRAGISFDSNRGVLAIFNSDATSVAELTEGESRGGRLSIFNAQGANMVVAGVAEGGDFGVVRAGPESFKPGYGTLGLPGSFIMGKRQ